VERNHGNMADSGGCCAGGHLGARILQSLRSKAIKLLLFHLYEFSEWHPFSSNLTYTLTDINNTHVCPLPTTDDEINYHKTVFTRTQFNASIYFRILGNDVASLPSVALLPYALLARNRDLSHSIDCRVHRYNLVL